MPDTERHVRPFNEFFQEQRKGAAHVEASEALSELVSAVVEHGKPGELNLRISVRPAGKGAGNVVTVTDKVTTKLPEADRPTAIFFADEDGNLRRNDPNQQTLPLRAVGDDDDQEVDAK